MEIVLFIITVLGFTAIPGPNAALIVATALNHGTRKGLQATLGINLGIALQLCFALLGTTWLLTLSIDSINWLAWSFSAVCIYLIFRAVFNRFRTSKKPHLSGAMSFSRALGISLTNPKGLIFFALILPPFLSKGLDHNSQSLMLSAIFLALTLSVDAGYVFFARHLSNLIHHSKLRRFLRRHKKLAKYRFKSWLKEL